MSKTFKIRIEDVAYDIADDNVLIINLRTGSYFHLTDVATRIWIMLVASKSLAEIAGELLSTFDVSLEIVSIELQRFTEALEKESLISLVQNSDEYNTELKVAVGYAKFVAPELKIFTDLQEFLLLDPIHEISNLGLPVGKSF